jgi:hypothetical protein
MPQIFYLRIGTLASVSEFFFKNASRHGRKAILLPITEMKRVILPVFFVLVVLTSALGHKPGASITWNREISRVFYARCANCHRQGGTSFSLMNYPEVQPRLVAIKDQVLGRKMPPWGAVKGFGDFRNDQGLTQEEIELIGDWIDQDAPRGNNPNMLPPVPKFTKPDAYTTPKGSIVTTSDIVLDREFILDGLFPKKTGSASSARIVGALPDGHTEPLLWLYEYKDSIAHPFLYRKPIALPKGTVIRGVPPGGEVLLLSGKKAAVKGR